jgi:hypothetical protein
LRRRQSHRKKERQRQRQSTEKGKGKDKGKGKTLLDHLEQEILGTSPKHEWKTFVIHENNRIINRKSNLSMKTMRKKDCVMEENMKLKQLLLLN